MFHKASILLLCVFICSCTWVRLTKNGELVEVKTIEEVASCQRIATTHASLRSRVIGIERDKDKVKLELETLARNAAVEYGGNVVAPSTTIEEGKQSFGVYECLQ